MYLAPSDLRSATNKWFAHGHTVSTAEASDAELADLINEVSAWWDYRTHDRFEPVPPLEPTAAPAGAAANGGSVDTGVHPYAYTFVVDGIESGPSPTVSVTLAGAQHTVNLTGIAVGSNPGTTARKVYRAVAGGTALKLVATIADNTTTVYADTASDATLGASPPDTTIVLTLDGSGSNILYTPYRIRSITSVGVAVSAGAAQIVQNANSYRVLKSIVSGVRQQRDLDALILQPQVPWVGNASSVAYAVWPQGPGTIHLTGTFGWASTPGRVKEALATLIWATFQDRGDLPERAQSVNVDGAQFNFPDGESETGFPEVNRVLREYTRTRPAPTTTSVVSSLYGGPDSLYDV